MDKVPYGVVPYDRSEKLDRFDVEVSWGSSWVSLNDKEKFEVGTESLGNSQRTWRKVVAESPVLGGDYLVHAVPGMVQELIQVRVRGKSSADMNDGVHTLYELFEQMDYRIRLTTNNYREYWRCQLAESTTSRGHVMQHNFMSELTFQVPRYPNVTRERLA